MDMHHLGHHRSIRDQIIAREVMKLELRQARERASANRGVRQAPLTAGKRVR
jgi:hypothetical protein